MLLESLVSTIETLRERIQTHGSTLRENETRTRMALIDPLLYALGWDTSNPVLVTPEYNVSGQWADYALLGPDGKPAATVEAKKLGEPLAGHRMQMLNYSNAAGIQYAGLTDGNRWELYKVFEVGTLDERRILELSIAEGASHRLVLQLLLLWNPNLSSGQPSAAKEPILVPRQASTTMEIETTAIPDATVSTEPGWVLMSVFDPHTVELPMAIRFSDGSGNSVKVWRQLVEHTVAWLWSRKYLTPQNMPVPSSNGKGVLVQYSQQENTFRHPRDVDGTPLTVDSHGNRTTMSTRAKHILEHCGLSSDDVQLQVGQ